MCKVRPLQRTSWEMEKSCNAVTQPSTSSWDEFIWHPCSGHVPVSETETTRELLSWLTCSCIMTFSNVLWTLQIRPQLSNAFLIYFFWLPANDNTDFFYCLCCQFCEQKLYLFICLFVLFCLRILHISTTLHKTCLSTCMEIGMVFTNIHGHLYCSTLWNDRMKGFLKAIWYHVHGLCWKNKQVGDPPKEL